jgi:hypothetical protein
MRAARFVETIQADLGRPVLSVKIFPFPSEPNHLHIFRHLVPHRGAARDRHERGAGCGGREAAPKTRAHPCGRRSRVVLTPRRWRQVGGRDSADDGGNKARSPGRARRKPLKPLRGECRATRRDRGDLLACFLLLHARLRARRAPGIPCSPLGVALRPLIFRRCDVHEKLARSARRERRVVCCRHCERSEAIHEATRRQEWIIFRGPTRSFCSLPPCGGELERG